MEIVGLHHIAIICSNYQKSKQFYIDVLGFEVIKEMFREQRNSYKLDLALNKNYLIELFSFPNPPQRSSYPEACGLRHLAFTVRDIKKIRAELIEKGIEAEVIRIDEYTEKAFFFISDPDGLPIEFYQI